MNEYPYWQKNQEATSFQDFFWNLPEQKLAPSRLSAATPKLRLNYQISEYTGAQFLKPSAPFCRRLKESTPHSTISLFHSLHRIWFLQKIT